MGVCVDEAWEDDGSSFVVRGAGFSVRGSGFAVGGYDAAFAADSQDAAPVDLDPPVADGWRVYRKDPGSAVDA
jgi:hypothetical protein